jgi:NAD(P)-dependent dehydrogenase (short-subunit alcohol dehydrogenase family)
MSNEFNGKVVLITGAGKGTGRRLAEAFAARGASVAANDVTPVNLDETARRITAAGGRVRAYVEDVAKKMPVQALLNAVLEDFGRLDVLVCCAEVEPVRPLLEMDDWDWQRTLDVNLSGAFLLVQAVGREMRARGGTIILLGDRAKGPGGRAAYFASKAGLEALARAAGEELSAAGIRVRHIQPKGVANITELVLSLCRAEEA